MQIIIDIEEKDYDEIMVMKSNCSKELSFYEEIIGNGVVIPEPHGRIIDAEELSGLIHNVGVIRAFNKVSTILESSYHE